MSIDRNVVPGLLVSVRNLAEAQAIAPLGIDVLDLKEPTEGPLAPVAPAIWAQVASRFAGKVRLSAALGEFDQAIGLAAELPPSFSFAKAGPASCSDLAVIGGYWTELRRRLPEEVQLVAVAYADHRSAGCSPPHEILELAGRHGVTTWLLDTFGKDGKSTLDHLSLVELKGIAKLAARHQAKWVLAGSMRLGLLNAIVEASLMPDLIGVRGDVCEAAREGEISTDKVARWVKTLKACSEQPACQNGCHGEH